MDLINRVSEWRGVGLLTVEMERAHRLMTGEQLHVTVNGLDVTRRCFCADSRAGFVFVFCRDEADHDPRVSTGGCHLNPNARPGHLVCTHRLVGKVEIAPGEPFV